MDEEISSFIQLLGGDRNPFSAPENHKGAIHRILDLMRNNGIPADILTFEHHEFTGYNLWVPPPSKDDDFVLILAHHDTVPESPGVDDNGSGLLLTYLLAKWYYSLEGDKPNLAFVMPDFEEGDPRVFKELEKFNEKNGTSYSYKDNYFDPSFWDRFRSHLNENVRDLTGFTGTKRFVEYLEKQNLLDKVKLVVDYETVGYTAEEQQQVPGIPVQMTKGDFLAGAINAEADEYFEILNSIVHPLKRVLIPVPNRGHPAPDTRRSDHSVFWDKDIHAIMFTDSANFRNPHYHKPTDTSIDHSFILDVFEYSKIFLKKMQ